MASTAFTDAYVRYTTQFPTLESLGDVVEGVPKKWQAELDLQSAGAFDPVTMTAIGFEGGNSSGSRNFAAITLVRALYAVRALRDPDYTNPYTQPVPEPIAGVRIGSIVRLGTGCN